MKGFENSDLFFVVESFKIFFEKVLNIISDPSGIAIQEWLKYKDVLSGKDVSPSSIYLYSQSLNIIPQSSSTFTNQIVKLKKVQNTNNGNGNGSNNGTPKRITRRASFNQDSPKDDSNNHASTDAGRAGTLVGQGEPQFQIGYDQSPIQQAHSVEPIYANSSNNNNNQTANYEGYGSNNQPSNRNGGQEMISGSSPWVERKKNRSPTKRMNTYEVQQLKGLSDFAAQAAQLKQNDQFEGGRKVLLSKVKLCIEMFKKDTVGLDLIHDRSFQTQTMLGDNKRKPFERGGTRQDSKFIREFSIYSKKTPSVGGQQFHGTENQQEQHGQMQYQPITPQQLPNPQYQMTTQNQVNKTPTPLLATNVTTTNNTFGTMGGLTFDFVKAKNTTNHYNNVPQQQKQADFQTTFNMSPSYTQNNNIIQQQQQSPSGNNNTIPSYQPMPSQTTSYQYQGSSSSQGSTAYQSSGTSYQASNASPHTPNTYGINNFQVTNGIITSSDQKSQLSGSGSPPTSVPLTPPQRQEKREIENLVQKILKEQKAKDEQAALSSSQRQDYKSIPTVNMGSQQQSYGQQQQQYQYQVQSGNVPSYIQMNSSPIGQNSSNGTNNIPSYTANYTQSSPGYKPLQK